MIDTVLVLRIDEEIILESKLKMCNEIFYWICLMIDTYGSTSFER